MDPSNPDSQPAPQAGSVYTPNSIAVPPAPKPISDVYAAPKNIPAAPNSNLPPVIQPPADIHYPQPLSSPSADRPKRLKLFAALIGLVLFLIVGGAAAYFGYIAPNKPENIWATALNRTGKGYDKLAQYAGQQASTKGVDFDSTFKLSGPLAADATLKGKSDGVNSDFSGSFSASGLKVSLNILTIKSKSGSPDLYIKANGLEGLGALLGGNDPQAAKAFKGFNNQWYFVDHTFFDQYAKSFSKSPSFTTDDLVQVVNAIGSPTKKYIFTSDKQNMAVVVKQKIGTEKQDGRNVYHFKVGFNKDNLKAYNNALCDSLKDTKLFTLIEPGNQTSALANCKNTNDIDNISDSATADAWVDTQTKLIHKIRIYTSQKNTDNYWDIIQNYTGGNTIPLALAFHQKSGANSIDGKFSISLDTGSNKLSIDGTVNSTGGSNFSGSLTIDITPNNTPVQVTIPPKSKNLLQLFNDLGIPLAPTTKKSQTANPFSLTI